MPRAIDHLVIPAHDLAAQAELYRRLGFQVGARNRHPWGTENHIVQFDGAFLELIGLGEGFQTPEPAPGVFSFAGFVASFLAARQGLGMLVMRSADAEADRREFAARGLGAFERFDFARKATKPDGRQVDVAFSLAFAASPTLPETGFFVCQQRFPENFWNKAAQIHPNGALGVAGLIFAHPEPQAAAAFLAPFLGADTARPEAQGVRIDIDGASVEIAPRGTLASRYGAAAIPEHGPALALARIRVANLAKTRGVLGAADVPFEARETRLIVGAETLLGASLAFEAD